MKRRVIAVTCLVLCLCGCSLKPQHEAIGPGGEAPKAEGGGREIVIEVRSREMKADAAKESSARYLAPAAVGGVGLLVGGNPLGMMLAYAASHVGLAAVEQGKSGSTTSVTARVPKADGEPSCTVIKPDGTTYVLTGGATVTALADGLPDGLSPTDAALWRRLHAATLAASPQPEGISPK